MVALRRHSNTATTATMECVARSFAIPLRSGRADTNAPPHRPLPPMSSTENRVTEYGFSRRSDAGRHDGPRKEKLMKKSTLIRSTLLVIAGALTAAGCQTTDAYTGEKKVNNTSKGAGIGALAGAVLGAATGDNSKERRERALIGAGVGALTGAGVGAYMDRQEAKLRAQLQGTGVSVTRNGANVILNMPGNVTFKTASADLNSGFFRVLDSVSLVLKEFDKTIIDVEGHTDSDGTDTYNQQLSLNRAQSVGSYLQSRGVNGQRIVAFGAGEARPVASNGTPDGKQQNRRVELKLQPIVRG